MIRLTDKTQQDFLNKQWIEKLQEAGIEINDNKYWLVDIDGTTYITDDTAESVRGFETSLDFGRISIMPTYTLAELQYKLSEWHPEYKGLKLGGPIMWKDAPFYFAQYENAPDESPYVCFNEFPLYAAAQLALNCVKNGFGVVQDVSDK